MIRWLSPPKSIYRMNKYEFVIKFFSYDQSIIVQLSHRRLLRLARGITQERVLPLEAPPRPRQEASFYD